jgi:hypothetical protein
MAIRKNLSHPDKVRARIRSSQLVNRLTEHVLGAVEMKPSQVTAALGLLKKTVPDLSAIEHTGGIEHRHAFEMTDAELARIATSGSAGTAEAASSTAEPTPVH